MSNDEIEETTVQKFACRPPVPNSKPEELLWISSIGYITKIRETMVGTSVKANYGVVRMDLKSLLPIDTDNSESHSSRTPKSSIVTIREVLNDWTMGSMSNEGFILAGSDSIHFRNDTNRPDIKINLRVTKGSVVLTSCGNSTISAVVYQESYYTLNIWSSLTGLPLHSFEIFDSCRATPSHLASSLHSDLILIGSRILSSSNMEYCILKLNSCKATIETIISGYVPVSENSQVLSMGFSECILSYPICSDSRGVIRCVFTSTGYWTPVFDSTLSTHKSTSTIESIDNNNGSSADKSSSVVCISAVGDELILCRTSSNEVSSLASNQIKFLRTIVNPSGMGDADKNKEDIVNNNDINDSIQFFVSPIDTYATFASVINRECPAQLIPQLKLINNSIKLDQWREFTRDKKFIQFDTKSIPSYNKSFDKVLLVAFRSFLENEFPGGCWDLVRLVKNRPSSLVFMYKIAERLQFNSLVEYIKETIETAEYATEKEEVIIHNSCQSKIITQGIPNDSSTVCSQSIHKETKYAIDNGNTDDKRNTDDTTSTKLDFSVSPSDHLESEQTKGDGNNCGTSTSDRTSVLKRVSMVSSIESPMKGFNPFAKRPRNAG